MANKYDSVFVKMKKALFEMGAIIPDFAEPRELMVQLIQMGLHKDDPELIFNVGELLNPPTLDYKTISNKISFGKLFAYDESNRVISLRTTLSTPAFTAVDSDAKASKGSRKVASGKKTTKRIAGKKSTKKSTKKGTKKVAKSVTKRTSKSRKKKS